MPPAAFRINALHFFLTYPRSSEVEHQTLHSKLEALRDGITNVYSCRERHSDGSYHHHAIVSFDKPYNCRNEKAFDIDHGRKSFHPNIQSVRDLGASIRYIGKGNYNLTLTYPIRAALAIRDALRRLGLGLLRNPDPNTYE